MSKTGLFCCFILASTTAFSAGAPGDSTLLPLTGNVGLDLFGMRELSPIPRMIQESPAGEMISSKKSPWLAGGLSLALPGAGEFYTESYWKSAGFLVVEVAMWALAYYWDKRGNTQTDNFQNFANTHWSVVRYVQRALTNFKPVDPNTGQPFTESQFWTTTPNPQDPWDGVNWGTVNRMEAAIGGYYSHSLAVHGDQQYYEMIGKYEQFNMGWDDANPALDPAYEVQKANPTARSIFYAGERGKANTYYGHATTFVTVAILNHFLSAVDAALSATWFNKAHASVGFQNVPTGAGYTAVPVLQMRIEF